MTRAKKAARPKTRRASAPAIARKPASKPKKPLLLKGGNPRIAKAEGDAPIKAYIAALTGWKQDTARRLDTLVTRAVPGVAKAVKWNSPFYGVEGKGWFLSFHTFTRYIKVAFFRGANLKPPPPGPSTSEDTRYLDIHEDDALDEAQISRWAKQAAALTGFLAPRP